MRLACVVPVLFHAAMSSPCGAAPPPAAPPRAAGGTEALVIGTRLELFVDDFLIERLRGAALELHPPVEREIALRFDAPWEGAQSAYGTVLRDGAELRMYYRGGGDLSREHACLATSADGVRWMRPELGLFEHAGVRATNIIWTGAEKGYWEAHNFSPFIDANPAAPAAQRYKAVTLSRAVPPGEKERRKVLMAFVSPDGIRWSRLRETPVMTSGSFDSHNVAFWDTVQERYVCYSRVGIDGIRSVQRSTSPDFVDWSPPEPLDFGAAPREHFYTNGIAPYFRAPHIYLGFPMRFVPQRTTIGADRAKIDALSDAVFITSRDGLKWRRTFMEAFIRPGLDERNWRGNAHGNNTPLRGLVQTGPAELSIYWMQNYGDPAGPHVRRGTLRLDGFVSVNAPHAGGELLTKPLVFAGDRLAINYATSAAGSMRVEIQDAAGAPLSGFALADCPEIYGDEIERTVAWTRGPDVGALAGRPVRLRFVMMDADLFALRFARARP